MSEKRILGSYQLVHSETGGVLAPARSSTYAASKTNVYGYRNADLSDSFYTWQLLQPGTKLSPTMGPCALFHPVTSTLLEVHREETGAGKVAYKVVAIGWDGNGQHSPPFNVVLVPDGADFRISFANGAPPFLALAQPDGSQSDGELPAIIENDAVEAALFELVPRQT
ncbi:hypothetical protein PTKU46_94920 [Paraburkholderia terrae]|uniref:hypothetical protein n=1 Tax=Paraburkholderia terrae TaxID=311230 RepID=UPI0030E1EDAF